MASYEDKQTKEFSVDGKPWPKNYYNSFYGKQTVREAIKISFGIGCVLGTLCHTLFTFRWGEIHYIMFFAAILATIYSLIQTHRRNSYAPYRDKKIEGFDIFCILLGIVLTILVIYKIRLY